MLDLIGYSTIPDDTKIALGRLDSVFIWFLSVPWWAVFGFATIATMWLMWVSWPRGQSAITKAQPRHVEQSTITSNSSSGLTLVEKMNFSDESRLLDGYYYKDCNFHNVQFTFNGGEYTIDGGTITGIVGIQSGNNAVQASYYLLLFLQTYKRTIPDNTVIAKDRFGNVSVTVDMAKDPTFERQSPPSTPA